MDFMVKHGIKGVVAGGTARGGHAERTFQRWRETMSKHGRETESGEDLALGFQIHLADTEEKAISEATPVYEEQLKVLAPLGRFPKLTEAQVAATFDPVNARRAGLPTLRDAVKDGTWLCGSPSQIQERISDIIHRFPGLDRISVGLGGLAMPPSIIREDIERFGSEVLPKL
jgi:alkanesulfonate monooxygenase SsuD/methylene tetrahydromethanopterin reductase-like flavin-dependent oxidoreductase (luciferase family)